VPAIPAIDVALAEATDRYMDPLPALCDNEQRMCRIRETMGVLTDRPKENPGQRPAQ